MDDLTNSSDIYVQLPSGYQYQIEKTSDNEKIWKIKEVADEASARTWLEKLSHCTLTTWRIARTYPNSGRHNVFKIDLRCTHSTDRRAKGVRSSKHTGCPAKLQIVVKRLTKSIEALSNDVWPTSVTMKSNHNHLIESAEVLKYRDMSSETRKKLITLFHSGHTATSALYSLKTDLMLEYGNDYNKIAYDGYYVPSKSIVEKLFKKELSVLHGSISDEGFSENSKIQFDESNKLSPEEEKSFQDLITRIKTGLKRKPKLFVPAVRKMVRNAKTYATMESGLLTALYTFGSFRSLQSLTAAKKVKDRVLCKGVPKKKIFRKRKYFLGSDVLTDGQIKIVNSTASPTRI